jgi:hypothetical protein
MQSDPVATVIGILLGVGTLLVGVIEYIRAQVWKRAEFLADVIKEFESSLPVRNVLVMLDWEDRKVELFPGMEEPEKRFARVNDRVFLASMTTHYDDGVRAGAILAEGEEAVEGEHVAVGVAGARNPTLQFTPVQAAVRDCLDEFLNRLERFESYVKSNLVSAKDFKPYLRYWLDIIGDPNSGRKFPDLRKQMWRYIDCYKFTGVQAFFKRFGYTIAPAASGR